MVAKEGDNAAVVLQLGLINVEVHAVDAFDFERDVFLKDFGNGAWYAHHRLRLTLVRRDHHRIAVKKRLLRQTSHRLNRSLFYSPRRKWHPRLVGLRRSLVRDWRQKLRHIRCHREHGGQPRRHAGPHRHRLRCPKTWLANELPDSQPGLPAGGSTVADHPAEAPSGKCQRSASAAASDSGVVNDVSSALAFHAVHAGKSLSAILRGGNIGLQIRRCGSIRPLSGKSGLEPLD